MGQHQHHMSSQPELIYFGGPRRADLPSIPAQCFGSMPCIHHDDLILAQSQACAVYAAELGIYQQGVLGDAPSVNRATDSMVLGAYADLQSALYACLFGSDESMPPVWKPFQTRQLHSWQG